MAGDVNKSVEITLRANLKQFQASLAQIPGMTKKEAGQMTRALAAEFRKSTKAAHKAAEESKKAARATAKEYKKTSEKVSDSFSKQAQAAKQAAREMSSSFTQSASSHKKLAESAEVQATSFGAASIATSRLIPNLSEGAKTSLDLADGLATAAEQAIKGGLVTSIFTDRKSVV